MPQTAKDDCDTTPMQNHQFELPLDFNDDVEMFQCQLLRMTGTSCIKSGEYVMAPSETAKSVDIGILELLNVQKFCQKF